MGDSASGLTPITPASFLLDAVTRLNRATVQIGNERLRPWKFTLSSYVALRVIADQPHLTLTQLSRRCFARPQTMTRMVTELQRRGFVERAGRPGDERAMSLTLTTGGRDVLIQMEPVVNKINDTIAAVLTAEQIVEVDDLLRGCAHAVERDIAAAAGAKKTSANGQGLPSG
jgi:DNA-binding MarR family transcriptional regulator